MKVAFVLLVCLFGSSFAAWNFKPLTSSSNCLTMSGDTTGTAYTIAACTSGNTYQQMTDSNAGPQLVMLAPFTSPTCNPTTIAVNTSTAVGIGNGAPVIAAAYDPGNKAHYWTWEQPPIGAMQGYLWYRNLATTRCMTMENGGSYIDNYDCSPGLTNTHQMWQLSAGDQTMVTGGGNSVVKNQNLLGTQCLDIKNSNPNPGAKLDAQLCATSSFAQNFQVIFRQPVTWKIGGSNQCMDGNICCGPAPFQYPCTPTAPNHQWVEFYYIGDTSGSHIMNVATGQCLAWNPSNLNDVHTEACVKGNTNQQWVRTAA